MGKLYRYESISSELKVWAERSPLSEWTDTTIVKKLRFQILFNQQASDRPPFKIIKIIRGNQNHLENLVVGMASYVDDLLSSSSDFELKLWHQLFIPNFQQFSQLEFSTLELFDLFTNLELLTRELEIFPTILNTSLGEEIRRNPVWFKVAAAAIATVGITTATRFLFPPEYSPHVANLNSVENSSDTSKPKPVQKPVQKPEQKLEPKSPNNSANLAKPKVITSPPRNSKRNNQETSETFTGRISPTKPHPPNINSAPQSKLERKPLLKSAPTSSPKDFTSSSDPKIRKSTPNPSRNEFPIPSVKTSRPQIPLTPAPIDPSLTSKSPQDSLGLSDSNNANRSTATNPEPTKANGASELTPSTPSQTSAQNFGRDSDRSNLNSSNLNSSNLNNRTLKDKNTKISAIKITGSPNSQDLQAYKQKIATWQSPKSSGEIDIEVRWQNRQITELKIQPENPELTELIERSLFEIFADLDGNVQISLKVTIP